MDGRSINLKFLEPLERQPDAFRLGERASNVYFPEGGPLEILRIVQGKGFFFHRNIFSLASGRAAGGFQDNSSEKLNNIHSMPSLGMHAGQPPISGMLFAPILAGEARDPPGAKHLRCKKSKRCIMGWEFAFLVFCMMKR